MPEFGRPGLPVLSDEERARRNALQQEWKRPYANTPPPDQRRPSLEAMYDDEPSTDELLNAAQGTLDDTALTQGGLNLAAQQGRGEGPASTEQFAPEHETYRDVGRQTARAAQLAGFGLSPFTGGASMAALSVPASAYLAVDEGIEAGQDFAAGEYGDAAGNAALAGLDALGTGVTKYLKPTRTPGPVRPDPGMNWTARKPSESPYRASGELPSSSTPDLPRYQLGPDPPFTGPQTGANPVPTGDPKNLFRESNVTGRPQLPLGSPSTPSNPPNYPWGGPETGAGAPKPPSPTSSTPPSVQGLSGGPRGAASSVPKVRGLSEGEERGVQELDDLLTSTHGDDYVGNDVFPGKGGTYKEPSVSPMVDPELQAALDALDAMDEASRRSIISGGVSSRGADNKTVRVKDRTPISGFTLGKNPR